MSWAEVLCTGKKQITRYPRRMQTSNDPRLHARRHGSTADAWHEQPNWTSFVPKDMPLHNLAPRSFAKVAVATAEAYSAWVCQSEMQFTERFPPPHLLPHTNPGTPAPRLFLAQSA